ncbi:MAG TPA: hypothetical protein VG013_40280 [Gemmataceae bacterium]|jgi:hypothetical protein|nr:hypothetical protein [Gemmataceae bacterium]
MACVRILDLDDSVARQQGLLDRYRPVVLPARRWGPRIRMACAFGRFRRFERTLASLLGPPGEDGPSITFCGSGDFHHVSLALVRRLGGPFNLLVVDNHPDWMRAVPLLHCGTWLYHAARLPQVRRVFHVGGDVDFDNAYRWLTPWRLLRADKVRVFPALRCFRRGPWSDIANEPLRPDLQTPVTPARIGALLRPLAGDLARWPLYVSLDKDVMQEPESVVNWDSGHLTLPEVCAVLEAFVRHAGGRLAGMDIVGDWSPVRLRGLLRRTLHWTEHPPLAVEPGDAARRNQQTNLILLERLMAGVSRGTAET